MAGYKKYIIMTLLWGCFVHSCYGQEWIPLGNTPSKVCISKEILESSMSTYKVRIKIHKILCTKVFVNGLEYQKLNLDDEQTTFNEGEPSLPLIIQHIGLPKGNKYSMTIDENEWEDIHIGKISPAQSPLITNPEQTQSPVSDSIYALDSYQTTLLEGSDIYKWKGFENFYIKICPFKYQPPKSILSVLKDFTLTVNFTGENTNNGVQRLSTKNLHVFDNYDFLTNISGEISRQEFSNDNCDYLIIVGNLPEIENSQAMKDFRRWKALKGFRTEVVSTSTIGSDSASIKSYIAQAVMNGADQVLFVGCNDKIPYVTLNAFTPSLECLKSDYWYGCLNDVNNVQADIPIGRFLTNTLEEFNNIVKKTIQYESTEHEWTNRALLVSHAQTGYFQDILENISNTDYDHPMQFYKAYGASVSQGGLGSDKFDVINYINEGMNLVTINCHGNDGCFWMFDGDNSTITYEDKDSLNDGTYPVILSNACYNGDFTYPSHSIARHFSCSSHCSTVYAGCTMPSYIIPGNQFLRLFYSNLLDIGLVNLGYLILQSHIMNFGYGSTAKDNAFNYICGGDPTLELWTGVQKTFDNVRISLNNNNIMVAISNTDEFNTYLSDIEGNLLGKYLTSDGTVNIPVMNVNFDFAVNKHDYIPYVIHVNTQDNYIQNSIIIDNALYTKASLLIGNDVTETQPYGNVIIQSGANVKIINNNEVTIKNGFECQVGATLTIE